MILHLHLMVKDTVWKTTLYENTEDSQQVSERLRDYRENLKFSERENLKSKQSVKSSSSEPELLRTP